MRATRGTPRVVQCMLFCGRGSGASGRWRAWSGPDPCGLKVLWHHRPDEAPARVEGTVATKEQFGFVLVDCIYLPYLAIANKNAVFFKFLKRFCQVLILVGDVLEV